VTTQMLQSIAHSRSLATTLAVVCWAVFSCSPLPKAHLTREITDLPSAIGTRVTLSQDGIVALYTDVLHGL